MEDRFFGKGDCVYDKLQNNIIADYDILAQMMNELYKIVDKATQKVKPILLIEDDSVCIADLEENNIYDNYIVIFYKQGSNKPEVLKYE